MKIKLPQVNILGTVNFSKRRVIENKEFLLILDLNLFILTYHFII